MSSFWDEWLKRFRESRGFFFPDIERIKEEMEREMAETFREMDNIFPRNLMRICRQPDGSVRREYGPFIYGYSVKIGPEGKPRIREFGNIKPGTGGEGRPPLNMQDSMEPLIDVIEEAEEVKVLAELPGVEKKDIRLYATEKTFTIRVDTLERKYFKELELPVEVDESSARSNYRNGVLETILRKKKGKGKGTQIKIE
jgi:HSP20 family protein